MKHSMIARCKTSGKLRLTRNNPKISLPDTSSSAIRTCLIAGLHPDYPHIAQIIDTLLKKKKKKEERKRDSCIIQASYNNSANHHRANFIFSPFIHKFFDQRVKWHWDKNRPGLHSLSIHISSTSPQFTNAFCQLFPFMPVLHCHHALFQSLSALPWLY